jgi:hypothetical protein
MMSKIRPTSVIEKPVALAVTAYFIIAPTATTMIPKTIIPVPIGRFILYYLLSGF